MVQLAVSTGKASWTDSLSHDVEETNTHPFRIYQPLQNLATLQNLPTPSGFTHTFRIYPPLHNWLASTCNFGELKSANVANIDLSTTVILAPGARECGLG